MKNFFKFQNLSDESVELDIYDEIGFFGTNAAMFRDQLREAGDKAIVLRINSPGGSIYDGLAIYNLLRQRGNVTAVVDGIAASIASVIAMAADTITMPENTFMLVHDPMVSGFFEGEAEDLRGIAEDLDKMKNMIVNIYSRKTEQTKAQVKKLMSADTLFTAAEAVAGNFADKLVKDKVVAKNCFRDRLPDSITNKFADITVVPKQPTKDNTMTPEEIKTLQDSVATLSAENKQLKADHEIALQTAANSARQEVTDAEKTRKSDIQAIADKYNKDGDLNEITNKAITGETTPADFKDLVLDAVNSRATTKPVKPTSTTPTSTNQSAEDKEYEAFKTAYADAKGASARVALVRQNKRFISRLSQEAGE